jgi:uncharacterized protein
MIDGIQNMFATVAGMGDNMVLTVFLIGFLFGGIVQYTHVGKFEKIAGFSMLKDTIVPKMLFLAIGIASIGIYFMVDTGFASYHIKPIMLGGLIVGGVLFGISMAIMGKCPGTGPISIAEGHVDTMVGAFGGLIGGLIFTIYYDDIFIGIMGENLGNPNIDTLIEGSNPFSIILFGGALIVISILIPKKEMEDEMRAEDSNETPRD